jgi:hypothetical protein
MPTITIVPTTSFKQTNSIAHDDWVGHHTIIFHVNLEHGGDSCGVLQLSVIVYDPTGLKVVDEFDQYIKPPANAVWSDYASEVHGLYASDDRIASAMRLIEVWNKRFVLSIEGHLDNGSKKGIIAAWGDQSCDCKWLFRITEYTHQGVLFMPRWCPYLWIQRRLSRTMGPAN